MNIDPRELLLLSCIPGIGPSRLRSLVNHFHGTRAVLTASAMELLAVEGIEKKTASGILAFLRGNSCVEAAQHAESQLSLLSRVGGRLVSFWENDYPRQLKRIFDPPPYLFVRGILSSGDEASIAVVGTRTPSAYGSRIAARMSRDLVKAGLTVVSGLARGIDTIAHVEALKSGGRTVAVIGSGVDVIYPPENGALAAKIIEHGALLSEFEMGAQPDAVNFPRRNRIISGICAGILVIETGVEGGAMITARLALDQNREVFAVPGPLTEQRASGTHLLIKEGQAKLVENLDDILAELHPTLTNAIKAGGTAPTAPVLPDMTLFEERVFAVVGTDPTHIDVLASRTGMPVSEVLVHLLSLECKELVKQNPGKFFVRT
jgi:DNA processing protein